MAKLDGQAAIKYAALGAGAVAVPSIVNGVGTLSSTLAGLPLWGTAIYGAITIGGIVMAGVGVGLVDQLFFSK